MFTNTEIQELISISNQITKLKKERVQKYGKNWAVLLGRKRCDNTIQLQLLKKLEEYMALNNVKIGKLSLEIGVSRNFFNRLKTRSLNVSTQKKIEEFLTKIENQNE